ncbi:CAP-Gly domain-containing linker protein 3-like [Homarus americanus]|uniref:CAP-Gly domain-containing linker protein 3-like n=1 Tax=Homarus americanus TaxID=6706 RepID=A0A8J5MN80_HOMAM|nr:CAP-Gly domain-containing linker protein 3-like [Homarus americanus]
MTALHYSAYFDVAPVLDLLLRDPQECIPTPDQYELVPDVQDVIAKLRSCLSPTASHVHMAAHAYTAHNSSSQGSSGKAVLKAMGLKLCDRVLISGVKTGTLRFVGTTEFATGLWAGVELETPTGRHNGTVKGVMYFRCAKNYGIFVPVNRLTKIPHVNGGRQGRSTSVSQRQRAKTMSHIHNTTRKIVVGDRVYVDMGMGSGSTRVVTGVVRYTGGVHFASSFWVGVELDVPRGTNDGSVNGTRYFTCRSQHGIFASPSRIIKISTEQNVDGSLDLCEPSTLRFSRHSLSSGHGSNTTINMISSGSLSLGYPAPISYSSHGPMSLGSSGTIMGVGSSSTINLDCNGAMTQNMNECCATCSSSCHLLDNQVYGSVKSAQSAKTAIYPPNTSMTSLNRSFSAR